MKPSRGNKVLQSFYNTSFHKKKYGIILTLFFYSFDPATWGHSPKDVEHVKIHVT